MSEDMKLKTKTMEEELGKVSSFNEASLKMRRLDTSQELINRLRTDMLGSILPPKKNYEIIISELLSLTMEVKFKLSTSEKKIASKWRDIITSFLEMYPIFSTETEHTFSGIKRIPNFNKGNWAILRKAIFEFEDFVKECLEDHGLSSPNQDEEAIWDK